MAKKSSYRIIAEAIANGQIANAEIPQETKKLSLYELKRLVEFEMDNAKADRQKAPRDGDCSWDQADPEDKKNWMEVLGIEDGDDKDEKIIYKGVKQEESKKSLSDEPAKPEDEIDEADVDPSMYGHTAPDPNPKQDATETFDYLMKHGVVDFTMIRKLVDSIGAIDANHKKAVEVYLNNVKNPVKQ